MSVALQESWALFLPMWTEWKSFEKLQFIPNLNCCTWSLIDCTLQSLPKTLLNPPLPSFTLLYPPLPSFTLLNPPEPYWTLLNNTRPYWILLDVLEAEWTLLDSSGSPGFSLVILEFSGSFYSILILLDSPKSKTNIMK